MKQSIIIHHYRNSDGFKRIEGWGLICIP